MLRGSRNSRLKRSDARKRGIQLALVAIALFAVTLISNLGHYLPWNPALRCFDSEGHGIGGEGCQTIIAVSAGSTQKGRGIGLTAGGPMLPSLFNLSTCMEPAVEHSREQPMTTDMFLAGVLPRLRLESALFSRQRPAAAETTVLVTFDVGRLYMLDGLCLAWGGAISVALYQAVDDGPPKVEGAKKDEVLRDAKYRVADLHARANRQQKCMLDITLYSEAVSSKDPFIKNLFPVNALRNRAMLMVTTALVMVLDGDLLPQADMRAKLAPGTPRGDALLRGAAERQFHVLPAFDTLDTSLAYTISSGNKAAAVVAYNAGTIVRFGTLSVRNSRYPQGCTDYTRWKTASKQYSVTYCTRYEPWGIVAREHSPWFDSRFRGYGRNKIMYAAALNSSGFQFVIEPDTFVIHRPHTKSISQRVFHLKDDRRLHDHVMDMWQQQADSGRFEPVVDDTALRCKQQLPWWRGVAVHVGHSRPGHVRSDISVTINSQQ